MGVINKIVTFLKHNYIMLLVQFSLDERNTFWKESIKMLIIINTNIERSL